MSATRDLNAAVERALGKYSADSVLMAVTGIFVGLTTEFARRNGYESDREIKIDGGPSRDITIHATKEQAT